MASAPPARVARHCLTVLALTAVTLSGCATPFMPRGSAYTTRKAVKRAAADDSFPSASEVGLATPDPPAKHTR